MYCISHHGLLRGSSRGKIDIKITPVSSTNIRRIKEEFFRDDAAWRKRLPPNFTLEVDPNTLTPKTSTPPPCVKDVDHVAFALDMPGVEPSSFLPKIVKDVDIEVNEMYNETDAVGLRENGKGITKTLTEIQETEDAIL
uniref:Uncharacterized protein n=1 Tax=Solanum tuberosum TaxID=4113 RepID=M1DQZ7_SOLTU